MFLRDKKGPASKVEYYYSNIFREKNPTIYCCKVHSENLDGSDFKKKL